MKLRGLMWLNQIFLVDHIWGGGGGKVVVFQLNRQCNQRIGITTSSILRRKSSGIHNLITGNI